MAPDSHTDSTPDTPEVTAFAAASDSMQNLLAQYFSQTEPAPKPARALTNVVRLKSPPAESPADKTLISPQAQSRAADAFAALLKHVGQPAEAVDADGMAEKASEQSWPASARTLVQSLREDIAQLREQLKQAQQEVIEAHSLADHDVLTPSLNRRAFLREVHRAMADCRRYNEQACILYIDMDNFKAINDTHGHAAGDAALIHTARMLQASIREGDSVGRMGGDEFAVLLRRADLESARAKAARLQKDLAAVPFEYDGLFLNTGGSFGVRAYAGQASAETWLSEADAAMFLVKKSSR